MLVFELRRTQDCDCEYGDMVTADGVSHNLGCGLVGETIWQAQWLTNEGFIR